MIALSMSNLLLMSVCCLGFAFGAVEQSSFAVPPQDPISKSQSPWVSKAQKLVGELLDLAQNAPGMDEPRYSSDSESIEIAISLFFQRLANLRKADGILWKLWLTTGMPPVVRVTDKSLRTYVEENASAYRRYVDEHADLTEEALQRIGLKNTTKSLGSPLWYMTMKYLEEKVGINFHAIIVIHVTPNRFLIEMPLSPDSYAPLSDAMSHWLDVNKDRIIWDSSKKRFYPRNGEYLGIEELSTILLNNSKNMEIFKKSVPDQRDLNIKKGKD